MGMMRNLTEDICDVRTRGTGDPHQTIHDLSGRMPALFLLFLPRSKGNSGGTGSRICLKGKFLSKTIDASSRKCTKNLRGKKLAPAFCMRLARSLLPSDNQEIHVYAYNELDLTLVTPRQTENARVYGTPLQTILQQTTLQQLMQEQLIEHFL